MASHQVKFDTLMERRIDEAFPPDQAKEHRELAMAAAVNRGPDVIRKCCGGRMHAVRTSPVFAPTRFSSTHPVFLFVVRPEIIDEELLKVCGDHIAPSVGFQHSGLGPLAVLTHREMEILGLIARGMSIKEIALTLHRSVKTVESHRTSIGAELNVEDRIHLTEMARCGGLTTRDIGELRLGNPPNQWAKPGWVGAFPISRGMGPLPADFILTIP